MKGYMMEKSWTFFSRSDLARPRDRMLQDNISTGLPSDQDQINQPYTQLYYTENDTLLNFRTVWVRSIAVHGYYYYYSTVKRSC